MITAAQARAARAILQWSVAEAAEASDMARNTVVRVEGDRGVNANTLKALRAAYEAAGVRFTGEDCICAPAREERAGP